MPFNCFKPKENVSFLQSIIITVIEKAKSPVHGDDDEDERAGTVKRIGQVSAGLTPAGRRERGKLEEDQQLRRHRDEAAAKVKGGKCKDKHPGHTATEVPSVHQQYQRVAKNSCVRDILRY